MEDIRTLLFVPGDSRRKLDRGFDSAAGAVICDLEDAVASSEKEGARETTRAALADRPAGKPVALVRVSSSPAELDADLATAAEAGADGVVVPKATPELLAGRDWGGLPLIAIVETAAALRRAFELASHPDVEALMLGSVDLGAELSLRPRAGGAELLFARSSLVVDSAAAGILPPVDGVEVELDDLDRLEAEARLARSLGFGAKACVHPRHLAALERAFAPSPEELGWAKAVLAAYDSALGEGKGVASAGGQMVDRPVAERARRLLAAGGVAG
jgi:citrate lyase subunit beta/citryl-CoA lyase